MLFLRSLSVFLLSLWFLSALPKASSLSFPISHLCAGKSSFYATQPSGSPAAMSLFSVNLDTGARSLVQAEPPNETGGYCAVHPLNQLVYLLVRTADTGAFTVSPMGNAPADAPRWSGTASQIFSPLSFTFDPQGNLVLGLDAGGPSVAIYPAAGGSTYTPVSFTSSLPINVVDLRMIGDHEILFRTMYTIFRGDLRTGQCTRIYQGFFGAGYYMNSPAISSVAGNYYVYENWWGIGPLSSSNFSTLLIHSFDVSTNSLRTLLNETVPSPMSTAFEAAPNGQLWIGTQSGNIMQIKLSADAEDYDNEESYMAKI